MSRSNVATYGMSLIGILMVSGVLGADSVVDNLTVRRNADFHGNISVTSTTNESQLILDYRFTTNSIPIPDDSGNSHSGNVYGATWTSQGKSGGAYYFDGIDNYIESANNLGLKGNVPFSISFWVKYSPGLVPGIWGNIVSIGSDSAHNLLGVTQASGYTKLHLNTWSSDNVEIEGGYNFSNAFGHIVASYDGTSVSTYVNGTLVHTLTVNLDIIDAPVRIAGKTGGYEGQYMNGTVDEVKIYNYALTSNSVATLYRNGYAGNVPTPAAMLNVNGDARFQQGVSYMGVAGNLQMGSFTNKP